MAPNRRSVPTSLSLSDSSDPESWLSLTINNNSHLPKVKSIATHEMVVSSSGGGVGDNINESPSPPSLTYGHPNSNNNSTGHYVNTKMLRDLNHLNNGNHINKFQVNISSSNNCGDNDKTNSCLSVSASSTPSTQVITTISSVATTTTSSSSVNHHLHTHRSSNNNIHSHHPWKNWPKIDLISSIDPFESTDSMISAFACVAHVINNDSANEEYPIDGDNEIIRINDDDSINNTKHNSDHGADDDEEDDNGSYDSSNHSNSLESTENYRPINKPPPLSVDYKSKNNNDINNKFSGKCNTPNERYINRFNQVNRIKKPSPPPLSTIPRPSQQPPSPPTISSFSTATTTITSTIATPTSSSSIVTTLVPNQINSSKLHVPQTCSPLTTSISASDHLYETIYPSNIRLTRDSKYFVDYQNYRSLSNQPVEPVSLSLDSPLSGNNISSPINFGNQTQKFNTSGDNRQTDFSDLTKSKDLGDMVRRLHYLTPSSNTAKTVSGRNSYKPIDGRLSASSTVNQSYNQSRAISYSQTQRSKPQAYNYHHPHHQHHLPGRTNPSSMYKPSLSVSSPSSSPTYLARKSSPLPPSSLSPPSSSPQSNHNQRLINKQSEDTSVHRNNHHESTSKSPNTTISRPNYLQFNKSGKNLSYDQVDGIKKPEKSVGNNTTSENSASSSMLTVEQAANSQIQSPNKLKPDQVYPNTISIPVISRANVRSTEEYATLNKERSLKKLHLKSPSLSPSSPVNSFNGDEMKSPSRDDSISSSQSKGKQPIDSPMSLTSLSLSSQSSSSSSPPTKPSPVTTPIGNNLIETKQKPVKSKSRDKSSVSPLTQSTPSPSSRPSFFSRFFSLTHVISRTFSVEKIDKHHRSFNDQGKAPFIKSAVSTPALSSSSTRSPFFTDLNGNNQTSTSNDNNNQFTSTRTLIDSPINDGTKVGGNQENDEPLSLSTSTSGSKSLQTKSSSSFVRAFKNRLSLRRSRRKVKVKVDVSRTKSDPKLKNNRYEDDKLIPKQPMKEETICGSIVVTSGDYMKVVEIYRPQGKPFGFFVARGTVNNVKGIFISRIDSNGEKAFQGLLEIGDRLIEIDGNDVTEASVIQVNQLMSNKTKLTLKIVPFSVIADTPKV